MNRPRARDQYTDTAWLTAALRQQAAEHDADFRRIDARLNSLIAQASAETSDRGLKRKREREQVWNRQQPRRLARLVRPRLIGVPLSVLAVLATATVAVGVSLGIGARTTHPANQAAPSISPRPTTSDHRQSVPQSTSTDQRPAGVASTYSRPSPTTPTGPLTATATVDPHSNRYWLQEDLSVTTTRAIRGLHVVVTVSGGSSVQSTGWWSTILAQDLDTTVSRSASGLTYDIALKSGQTLQPATYVFGIQFDRSAAGHDVTLDAYTATATTTDNATQASVTGAFSE